MWSTTTFLVYPGNLRSFQLYGTQNHLCACLLVLSSFYFLGTRTAFLAFFGQIDWCWLNLTKKNVFPVLLLNYAVSAFLHCIEVLVFLQVITMIVTLYHCKECFCRFSKLRCCQVFLQRKRSSPVCGFIKLILAVSHSNDNFSLF